jgi:hypothetical protein
MLDPGDEMTQPIVRATELTRLWWDVLELSFDTHLVMSMRVMGMSGTWSVPSNENHAMIREKAPAFTEAMVAGVLAAWSGHGPDRVLQAVVAPISERASANRKRLARRGPRMMNGFDAISKTR